MKVAVNFKPKDNKYDYIYVFDDEPLEELIKTGMHCINKKYIEFVDINLTDYDIDCYKKTTLKDKDWDKIIKKDYKITKTEYKFNKGIRR